MESLMYILRSIVALVIVIWLANVALKYLNKYSNHKTRSIQIIERISVSKTSSLAIVKIVDDYYLMSFSENTSETLQKFSQEEAEEIEARQKEQEQQEPIEVLKKIDFTELKEKYTSYFDRSN
jgi:flagellar protein FliO/FliZ